MARLPIVPENWLDAGQPPAGGTAEPANNDGESHDVQPNNPIGPVKGFPETGRDTWRAGNDPAIIAATVKYIGEHNYHSGDAEYVSPELMKAWMMRESGGSPAAFKKDPFQVNNWADWDAKKAQMAGLSRGQAMTPRASADAALKWLHYKGCIDGHYQGHYEALKKYNAAPGFINGIPKKDDYAHTIINNARESYGDWKH
jgi:hypothetical protein